MSDDEREQGPTEAQKRAMAEQQARLAEMKATPEYKELRNIAQFIADKDLNQKQTLLMGRQVLDFFRGERFHEIVLEHKEEIKKMFKVLPPIPQLETVDDSMMLGQMFVQFNLMFVVDRHPNVASDAKRKYPKNVYMPRGQRVSPKGFYFMDLGKPIKKQVLFLGFVVFLMIAFMCFNLWPLWVKIGIWYVSFYLLVFLIGIIVVRFVVWLFLFHFGCDFWIFPNFFIDSNDILDSFRPLYSFERRDDDSKMMLLRVFSAIGIIYMLYTFSQDPENIEGLTKGTREGMDDLFNWGNDRFVLGRIADKSGNATKRKKSAREIFMDAILEGDEEDKKAAEGIKLPEFNSTKNETAEGDSDAATNATDSEPQKEEVDILAKINAEGDAEAEEEEKNEAEKAKQQAQSEDVKKEDAKKEETNKEQKKEKA